MSKDNGDNGVNGAVPSTVPGGFVPSERMETAREYAEEQWEEKQYRSIARWMEKSRKDGSFSPALTMREWQKWEKVSGFRDWWRTSFPEMGELTATDVEIMNGSFWQGLHDRVLSGDSKGMELYAKVRGLQDVASGNDDEFSKWLAGDGPNGWKSSDAAEA